MTSSGTALGALFCLACLSLIPPAGGQPLSAVEALEHAAAVRALLQSRFAGLHGLLAVAGGQATLAAGASGEHVRALQQALVEMGFAAPTWVTGSYGDLTARAVRNFQVHARGAFPAVAPTGRLDAATLEALATLAPAAGARGQRGNLPSSRWDGVQVRVLVVKREHRTFVFDDAGRVQHVFLNAVGAAGSPTHSALKTVDGKLGLAETQALGRRLWGNSAVFGQRLVGLSGGGQELHGTHAPGKLGLDVSHGCVRHHDPDILVLYGLVKVGDRVAIVERIDDPQLGAPTPVPGR